MHRDRAGRPSRGAVTGICPAEARDLTLLDTARAALTGLHRQEAAALTVSAAVLGFSVVAAILLMRTRVRATAVETVFVPRISLCKMKPTVTGRCCSQNRRF